MRFHPCLFISLCRDHRWHLVLLSILVLHLNQLWLRPDDDLSTGWCLHFEESSIKS